MAELVKVRPDDPIQWLADYLVENNPNGAAAAPAAKRARLDPAASSDDAGGAPSGGPAAS